MREILFRGKRLDNGEWVEGYYVRYEHMGFVKHIIVTNWAQVYVNSYEVDPLTVGQFTGLLDKNGKKIFEGDTIKFPDVGEEGYEYKEGYDIVNFADVVFKNGRFELSNFGDENSAVLEEMQGECHEDFIGNFESAEVIGTIYDKE